MIKSNLDKFKNKISSFFNSNKQKNNPEPTNNQLDPDLKDEDQSSDDIYPLW